MSPVLPASDIDKSAALDHLFRMLRVDSTWGKEGALAAQLARTMGDLGFEDVHLVDVLPARPSVVGRLAGTGGGNTIVLDGHLDIYELSSDWTRDPFQPAISDERIYGAGIADEKAGTAALFAAACEFLPLTARPRGDIVFIGASAHFEGGLGTKAVLESGIQGEGGITCEPSNLRLNTNHRGAAYLTITTYGKQAHTTAKEDGYNAIMAMLPVLEGLERLELPFTADSLGGPIINIGTIQGGTKHNQVPDRCEATVDVRLPSALQPEEVLDAVQRLLSQISTERDGLRASVAFSPFWLSGPRYPSATRETDPIVGAVRAAMVEVDAHAEASVTLPVWSDMCVLNSHGIPTVNIGPGGPPYNWADEYVSVDEYLRAVRIYKSAIRAFCDSGGAE